MGDVEIVVKVRVPEDMPRVVVERTVEESVRRILRVRKFFGIAKPKKRVEELIEEADSAWTV